MLDDLRDALRQLRKAPGFTTTAVITLGADRGDVVRMVLHGAFSQIGIGLALGIPAAIGAGKLMSGQQFGVRPWDPVMLTLATVLLGTARGKRGTYGGTAERVVASSWMATLERASHK